jgi:hypothetical protein
MIWSAGKFVLDMGGQAVNSLTGGIKSFLGMDDFIWRPGQAPISINPNDTLVGTKGGMGGGQVTVVNNFYGFTQSDLDRALDDSNRRTVDAIRGLVKS